MISKCKSVCKTYDALQCAFSDILEADSDIIEIRCNVQLEGLDYTSDVVCDKANGELMVRECEVLCLSYQKRICYLNA